MLVFAREERPVGCRLRTEFLYRVQRLLGRLLLPVRLLGRDLNLPLGNVFPALLFESLFCPRFRLRRFFLAVGVNFVVRRFEGEVAQRGGPASNAVGLG